MFVVYVRHDRAHGEGIQYVERGENSEGEVATAVFLEKVGLLDPLENDCADSIDIQDEEIDRGPGSVHLCLLCAV